MKASIGVARDANQISRDNMNASRRAWLVIDRLELKHPTKFTEEEAIVGVNVTVKNIGQTPAMNVWLELQSNFTGSADKPFMEVELSLKETLRQHPVYMGHIIFPRDQLIESRVWTVDPGIFAGSVTILPSGEKRAGFGLLVGVTYRIVGDDRPHITYHVYEMLNIPIGTAVPSGKVWEWHRSPLLVGEAD